MKGIRMDVGFDFVALIGELLNVIVAIFTGGLSWLLPLLQGLGSTP